jgi:hypothetical protein
MIASKDRTGVDKLGAKCSSQFLFFQAFGVQLVVVPDNL